MTPARLEEAAVGLGEGGVGCWAQDRDQSEVPTILESMRSVRLKETGVTCTNVH